MVDGGGRERVEVSHLCFNWALDTSVDRDRARTRLHHPLLSSSIISSISAVKNARLLCALRTSVAAVYEAKT